MKTLLSLLIALMLLGGQANAEQWNICNGQIGAAYGLCNAYCNAMECASISPMATEAACARVSDLYEQLTGTLPPTAIRCPVWTHEELEATYSQCGDTVQDNIEVTGPSHTSVHDQRSGPSGHSAYILLTEGRHYKDVQFIRHDEYGNTEINRWEDTSDEEFLSCTNDIMTHAFTICDN